TNNFNSWTERSARRNETKGGTIMGKIIVLTGATRVLGRGLVAAFAVGGHTVIGCGRSRGHVAELRHGFPPPHQFAAVDVADAAPVQSWCAALCATARS